MQRQLGNQQTILYKNRFAFWFVFSLVLNGYASGVPGVSLGSAVYIIIIIESFLKGMGKRWIAGDSVILSFGAMITFSSFIGMMLLSMLQNSISLSLFSHIIGLGKFWIWVLMSSVVVREYYDQNSFTNWMTKFAIILTVYLLLQCIAFYGAQIYLPNIMKFGPLQPYADGYADYESLSTGAVLRPGSFLSESSFYGNFIMCTTVLYLEKYIKELHGKRLYFIIFVSIGIILSGSTSAIILQGLILFLYYRRVNANLRLQLLFLMAFAGIVIAIMWFSGLRDSFIGYSLEYAFEKFNYLDRSTRFGKSYGYLSLIPKNVLYIGAGIGNDFSFLRSVTGRESIYLNSVTSLIVQSGIVGCIFFMILMGNLFRQSIRYHNLASTALLCVYLIKGAASGIYFSTYGIFFIAIIMGQIITERSMR